MIAAYDECLRAARDATIQASQSKLAEALKVAAEHIEQRQAERDASDAAKKLAEDIARDREQRKLANRKFARSLAALKAQFSYLSH